MKVSLSIVLALSLSSSLVACKKSQDNAPAASGSGSAATAPAPKAFSGTLTQDLVMESAHKIDVYTADGKPSPFAASLAQAKTQLGEPTRVDGTKYYWGLVEGDKCTYYMLEDKGGIASSPGSVSVASTDAECLAAIGKAPAAGSDGSAAGSAAGSAGSADGSGSATK